MNGFALFGTPWWVNALILVPVAAYFLFRKSFDMDKRRLLVAAVFGAAFGFVEAAVVIYLRAAFGLISPTYEPIKVASNLPASLLAVEFFREAATIVMLASVAWLSAQRPKERAAMFLWTFAFWDIFYYLSLRAAIGWPGSLTASDVLFLIPVPWIAQAWFPLAVSGLTVLIVWFCS